ncbi:hypothetical protein BDZ97DRAFT_1653070 [Flammula alnicola]|nr:hypothetical protein BDZ97DRAFT_1653070 [Flammula alnicola]
MSQLEWGFTEEPPKNSTSHLIFDNVRSLLQHWPNTRYRNGHTIVPGTIPVGTLLYHGTSKAEIPKVPEWTATDPEHSYLFCRSVAQDSGCWHLTLVATRPLKVLYFDGSSAAKMLGGPMDTQDLVVWGKVVPENTFDERRRIAELCRWGKQYGVDGFLRMEMDFEIMLCDFSAGVQTVSFLNLAPAGGTVRRPPPQPRTSASPAPSDSHAPRAAKQWPSTLQPSAAPRRPTDPRRIAPLFRVVESGSWHNHYPGETRIQLDYSRLISFYDPLLFPSLQIAREGQGRLDHRLDGISANDVRAFRARVGGMFAETDNPGSGVDWRTLFNTVTDRYAERLELLPYILNATATASEADAEAKLKQAHRHITSMLAPYVLHSSVPPKTSLETGSNHSWAAPVFEFCATTHTHYIETNEILASKLTPSENTLLGAVKGVEKEICRILVSTWAEGVEVGLTESESLNLYSKSKDLRVSQDLAQKWRERIEDLMKWLDWSSYWLRCRPECSYEEMCYLPTWPFFSNPPPRPRRPTAFLSWVWEVGNFLDGEDPEENDWKDPQPKCVRRVEPLEFK